MDRARLFRLLFFLAAILAGLAAGLYYGWMINPVTYVNTTPEALRADYKADYVLMVAEVYHDERDASLAARRLDALGNTSPLRSVQQAIITARELNDSGGDVELLAQLAEAIRLWSPAGAQP